MNKKSILGTIFGKNFTDINLKEYKIQYMMPQTKLPRQTIDLTKRLPRLTGQPYEKAEAELKKRGLIVEFVKGNIAPRRELANTVQSQFPKAYTLFAPKQKVLLTLYVSPTLHKPADYIRVPKLVLDSYKDAKKQLTDLGFKVELRKGSLTNRTDLLYHIQEQYPPANSTAVAGTKIVLVLYVKPEDVKPRKQTAARPRR